MNLDTLLIVFGALGIISAIINIIDAFSSKSKLKKGLVVTISLLVFLIAFVVYFKYDTIIKDPLPPPPITDPINIKGSYSGYFIDKLGSEVPTYLEISLDSVTDSIKFIFKNDYTVICNGEYDISNQKVIVNGLNSAEVTEENGKVIIESKSNIENKWKFIKDRREY